MKHKHEIGIPPEAQIDARAVELARVWASDGKQQVMLRAEMGDTWSDPMAWGLMLVDLARHAARAYVHEKGYKTGQVLARIKEGFDAEWASPDSERNGNTHIVSSKGQAALAIPPEAEGNDQAFELLRIWESRSTQNVTIWTGTLRDDPMPWGYMLVDLAQHVAKRYIKDPSPNATQVLARIKYGLDVDWHESDTTSGKLVKPD